MKHKNKLILEFTEFNAMRLNPDSAQMAVHADNPGLSINAFDRHEDAIRAGVSRLNTILHSLSNSANYRSLKSRFSLEDQKLSSLKILRIVNSNNIDFNVYVSFVIDGEEYYGVVENILSRDPKFKSEVFKDFDLVQSKEWVIRTKGLVIKSIKEWLLPEEGWYIILNDKINCTSVDTGRLTGLDKGMKVELVRAYDNKIIIKYNNDYYNLVNNNFIYFNWWFQKIDQ